MEEREIRTLAGCEIRAEGDEVRIEGYAAVFDKMSESLGPFREVIKAGAFDRSLSGDRDIRALVDHNDGMPLGRRKAGTLELRTDKKGLAVSIKPGRYSYVPDVIESVKRGDRGGMSFAFRTVKQAWVEDEENDLLVRELHDVELLEVSPVVFPAYPQTSVKVSQRALREAEDMRAVPSNVSTSKASEDTPWSAPTLSDFTGDTWGDLSAEQKRRIAGHFAYSSEMPPDSFGSLKLPHHRASDGAVVLRGVAAAAGRLNQAQIPSGQVAAVRAHLGAHYRAFGRTPPWEADSLPPFERMKRWLILDRDAWGS